MAALESLWQRAGTVRDFTEVPKEQNRVFFLSAELLSDSGASMVQT